MEKQPAQNLIEDKKEYCQKQKPALSMIGRRLIVMNYDLKLICNSTNLSNKITLVQESIPISVTNESKRSLAVENCNHKCRLKDADHKSKKVCVHPKKIQKKC